MSPRIHFPDGTHEDIIIPHAGFDSPADEERVKMERILRERLGDDMANWFDRFVDDFAADAAARCVGMGTDGDDYEKDCDNFRQILCAVQLELVALTEALRSGGRIDRKKLVRALDSQIKVINDTL